MKILFLARLFHPHIGGVETHVLELSKALIKKGHQVEIITEGYDDKLKPHQTYQNISIHRIPVSDIEEKSKKFVIWEWLYKHKGILKSADLIHVHDVGYWLFPIFFLNRNIFITYHGYEGSRAPSATSIIQRKIGELIAKKTINIGHFMQKWHRARPDLVLYGAAEKVAKLSRTKDIVYIGRLHPDTGIMLYLKAMHVLNKQKIKLTLDVYGDGPQKAQAVAYAKKHSLSVKFFGFKAQASELLGRYRLAFVSRYLTLLEAFIAKTPVIATYHNEIKKDYLTMHPMAENFTVASSPDKIADAVIKLMRPTKAQQLKITRAYIWAKQQTWKKLTDEYLDLWGVK